jgi:hypothetical protein
LCASLYITVTVSVACFCLCECYIGQWLTTYSSACKHLFGSIHTSTTTWTSLAFLGHGRILGWQTTVAISIAVAILSVSVRVEKLKKSTLVSIFRRSRKIPNNSRPSHQMHKLPKSDFVQIHRMVTKQKMVKNKFADFSSFSVSLLWLASQNILFA